MINKKRYLRKNISFLHFSINNAKKHNIVYNNEKSGGNIMKIKKKETNGFEYTIFGIDLFIKFMINLIKKNIM